MLRGEHEVRLLFQGMRDSVAIIGRDQIKRFFLMFFNNRIELLGVLVSICLLKNRQVVGNDVAL
jgi:hypothetical protein